MTGYNGLKIDFTTACKSKIAGALEKNEETFRTNEVTYKQMNRVGAW